MVLLRAVPIGINARRFANRLRHCPCAGGSRRFFRPCCFMGLPRCAPMSIDLCPRLAPCHNFVPPWSAVCYACAVTLHDIRGALGAPCVGLICAAVLAVVVCSRGLSPAGLSRRPRPCFRAAPLVGVAIVRPWFAGRWGVSVSRLPGGGGCSFAGFPRLACLCLCG